MTCLVLLNAAVSRVRSVHATVEFRPGFARYRSHSGPPSIGATKALTRIPGLMPILPRHTSVKLYYALTVLIVWRAGRCARNISGKSAAHKPCSQNRHSK